MNIHETDRLMLRQFCQDDIDFYAEMCADPEVMRFIGDGKTMSREVAWRNMAMVIGHWKLRGYGLWAVELKANGKLIGRIGCWNPEGWPGFEIGWMLHRDYWGNGFATEAALYCLRHAFVELEQPAIISLIHPGNKGSVRVAERIGENYHGKTELFGNLAMIYKLERSEWEQSKAK